MSSTDIGQRTDSMSRAHLTASLSLKSPVLSGLVGRSLRVAHQPVIRHGRSGNWRRTWHCTGNMPKLSRHLQESKRVALSSHCRMQRTVLRLRGAVNSRVMPNTPRDVQEFLDGYPHEHEDAKGEKNLNFLRGTGKCSPYNLTLLEILQKWRGDYDKLESEHGYIQWLFPIREHGMNYSAQPLLPHEIEQLKDDDQAKGHLRQSYELMLDFYGMKLDDTKTGKLARSEGYKSRYANLTSRFHNYLRISRILKSLGELGYAHYAAPFVLFVLSEQSEHKELASSSLQASMDRWWANCNRNESERQKVGELIEQVRAGKRKFTTKDYDELLNERDTNGTL